MVATTMATWRPLELELPKLVQKPTMHVCPATDDADVVAVEVVLVVVVVVVVSTLMVPLVTDSMSLTATNFSKTIDATPSNESNAA